MGAVKEPTLDLYEADFHAWTFEQAEKLRRGDLKHLDVLNLIDEIEALGISQQKELQSRLAQLLMHLLKWQYQPAKRTKSWARTIHEQRRSIERLLIKMPSLRPKVTEAVVDAYGDSLVLFERETRRKVDDLPEDCPYTAEHVMQMDWLPGD